MVQDGQQQSQSQSGEITPGAQAFLRGFGKLIDRMTLAEAMGSGAIAGAIAFGPIGALAGAGVGWIIVTVSTRQQ